MKGLPCFCLVVVLAALVSCSGSDGANGLVAVNDEPAGASCPAGGTRIDSGLDDNGNGTLDADEVDSTTYVCNGADAVEQLVRVTTEPPGANCAYGGDKVELGGDDDGNGTLDDAEVESTSYICDGADGADGAQTLVAITPEPAGSNCANGGQRIDYGTDDNADAALDPGEVDGTAYVCNGVDGTDGLQSLIAIDDEPSGANCTAGGIRVRHGLDDDGDGTLDDAEVDGTAYVCDAVDQFTGFADSYTASFTFTNQPLTNRPCGLAWDGAELWSCNLGNASGNTESRYGADFAFISYYQPGIDFRAMFPKGDGTSPLYARPYASSTIRQQTSPGVWTDVATLTGGTLDNQSNVHWDDRAREYIAMIDGTVTRWNESGALLGTVTLTGFGTLNSESTYPNNRGIIWAGGVYMTYSNGVLSAWSKTGARLDTTTLTGAGTSTDSHFSLAYARGMVWIVDANVGSWRGYDVLQ